MITLTDKAIAQLKMVIEKNDTCGENTCLRVSIEGGGCSGFQYNLGFIEQAGYDPKTDSKYEQDGITLIVDRKSSLYIDGTTIDWYDDLAKRGFTFENPNANKTCGCGSSFSA
jgi:iron-sulfur cluster assembly protein